MWRDRSSWVWALPPHDLIPGVPAPGWIPMDMRTALRAGLLGRRKCWKCSVALGTITLGGAGHVCPFPRRRGRGVLGRGGPGRGRGMLGRGGHGRGGHASGGHASGGHGSGGHGSGRRGRARGRGHDDIDTETDAADEETSDGSHISVAGSDEFSESEQSPEPGPSESDVAELGVSSDDGAGAGQKMYTDSDENQASD